MFVFSYIYLFAKRIVLTLVKIVVWLVKTAWWLVRQLVRAILAVTKPAMRYLAFLLLIVAVLALVADLTPMISYGRSPSITSITEHWQTISPTSLAATEQSVTQTTGAWAWRTLELFVLDLPTFFVFGLLGMLAAYSGRRRKTLNVFVN